MHKKYLLAYVVGLVFGIVGTFGVLNLSQDDKPPETTNNQMITSTSEHNDSMSENLKKLSGDEFDKAFIDEMILHHEGAISMARLAETNAKHDEIKKLGRDIIEAQDKEIKEMKSWLALWNYDSETSTTDHMEH